MQGFRGEIWTQLTIYQINQLQQDLQCDSNRMQHI